MNKRIKKKKAKWHSNRLVNCIRCIVISADQQIELQRDFDVFLRSVLLRKESVIPDYPSPQHVILSLNNGVMIRQVIPIGERLIDQPALIPCIITEDDIC